MKIITLGWGTLLLSLCVTSTQASTTERVSVNSAGTQGEANSYSYTPAISADGRYVTFYSNSSNLVSGDTNGVNDVFVHDRNSGNTVRVSISSTGTEGDGASRTAAISADGRYVTFNSYASNLVSDDTNGTWDVFVHDRNSGDIERVSVSSTGTEGVSFSQTPAISADGRYVAFTSYASNLINGDTNGTADVLVHDRNSGTTERVSVSSTGTEGDYHSQTAAISADGRYVTFYSGASNLVNDDTNGTWDVFVHDRNSGAIERVSISSTGTQGDSSSYSPAISSDGRYVAFSSDASNLVSSDTNSARDVFVHVRTIDSDGDGIVDNEDNCPTVPNPGQEDSTPDITGGDACVDPKFVPPEGVDIPATTIIEHKVTLSTGVSLGNYNTLGERSEISLDVTLNDYVTIGENSSLSQGTTVGSNTTIGSGVTIEQEVYIGSGVTIGDDVLIGRNSVICDDVAIGNLANIGKDVLVRDDPTLNPDVAPGDNLEGEKDVTVDPSMCSAP